MGYMNTLPHYVYIERYQMIYTDLHQYLNDIFTMTSKRKLFQLILGAIAAASAFIAGPKSMTALPMVRHPTVSLQSPGTKVQTASLIRSTTPPTSKSPTPGVTIAVTQASEGAR